MVLENQCISIYLIKNGSSWHVKSSTEKTGQRELLTNQVKNTPVSPFTIYCRLSVYLLYAISD